MKKILSIAAAAALVMSLVSCGSTGGAAKKSSATFDHPMTYTLDMADSELGTEIKFVDNSQYGTKKRSTRQNNNTCPTWTKMVKVNKPQVGDKVRVTGIITSSIDIDHLYINLVDNSPAANYWGRVAAPTEESEPSIDNVKAGEPVTIDYTFDITAKVLGNLILNMAYGEQNDGMATLTVERVCASDIGTPNGEIIDPQHKEPKTWEFDISKNLAYVEVKPEYPWENGVQNTMADPLYYQAVVSIMGLFGEDMPIAGDKLHLTWRTRSSGDIAELQIRAVENTAAVNWWKELSAFASVGTDIKAG